ncbi:MAG: hypothetical protein PHH59_06500 [Methylovulum sp.]|uniref:hypothetical protein n=1 Tax=Methylovulum sp. TaxID=1916980 RepID=UPI0026080E6C|nr:hypothetical protein [Methylovulum sp.]MDD2723656.1 hypothetical protein [Methylovulum sp.]
MQKPIWSICLVLCLFSSLAAAKPFTKDQVPEPLKPWIDWVAQENPERGCPFLYTDDAQKRCYWPTATQLDLAAKKGVFTSLGQVFKDTWVQLPGDSLHWPQNVTVNKQTALVMEREGIPTVKITAEGTASSYQIHGEFLWEKIPDNLPVPMDTGLINLSINGQSIAAPTIHDGQLWLKESESGQDKPENVQNSLDIQVFRHFTDDVPLQVVTRLVLDVAGEQREIKLAKPVLDSFIAFNLASALPARLENDGQLLVQVRPGHWQIDITARSVNEPNTVPFPTGSQDWPESEIWLFQASPDVRVVEIEQLSAIDTSQSNVPDEWKNLPAYSITTGQAMAFKVIRRGDPEPDANQLTINRKLWLDFDGQGYTANDTITGKISRGWRLNALPQTQLGKVSLNEGNLLITRLEGSDKQGVEVRQGSVNLQADSRIVGKIGALNAVGWEQDFHQVTAELNLPPGWRLLAASGVDNVPDSWLSRWTLLDLFMVLCSAIAIGMIWNYYWCAFALLTLILIWHEPDAPHFVWLNIIAATALLNELPKDKFLGFAKLVKSYRLAGWLGLVLISLPFMVDQVHNGLYPQLEAPVQVIGQNRWDDGALQTPLPASAPPAMMGMIESDSYPAKRKLLKEEAKAYLQDKSDISDRIDPTAKVQTGPGLPEWQWHKIYLSWNGSVSSQQQLGLWYLSPPVTMLLNFLRVLAITVLAMLMFGVADKFRPHFPKFRATPPALLALLLLPVFMGMLPKAYADYPSEALLNELKARLQKVETPDCLPACADIPQMAMSISQEHVELVLQIHASAAVVLPLPAEYGQWFPNQVLDNGEAATALYRDGNNLWIHLKQGGHRVTLRGTPPLLSQFSLPLPLKPKRLTLDKSGWEVVGIQENAVPDTSVQFSRTGQTKDANNKTVLEPGTLPPFISVQRTLSIGLDWRVYTRVSRLSPLGSAVVLKIGLLPGEAVSTEGIHVKDGMVEVNMSAQDSEMEWFSTLAKAPSLELLAPTTEQWTEVWKANVSPVWHVETQGIAPIHSLNQAEWLPEWHPWPGEKITLQITRPEAVNGQTLTIDNSQLNLKPGQRLRDTVLNFNLRSSQGSQHTLTLPENAILQSVAINGQTLPIRLQDRKLTLPVTPGKQAVSINWQEDVPIATAISTSAVDLGLPSVNSRLNISLGQDRWVLWVHGPTLGPAILFWGVLVVILIVALGLGKISLTPLKHWQWFLLLIGLSQVPMTVAGIVILWLMLLGWRQNQTAGYRHFNGLQVLLACLTLLSLGVLFAAVAQGLLSTPDMRITGNGSSAFNLNWYEDRSLSTLPIATVISVPVLAYRLLMLAWSLWLAVSLLNWLKWGWSCFASNGLWRKQVVLAPIVSEQVVAEQDEANNKT